MQLFVKARSFLRNLFLSRHVEVDLDQEVHSHLEMLIEENIRAGMPLKEARRAARIDLGGVEQVKEQVREVQIGNWLHSVISDCRYGLRQLRKNPAFTTVAILTLALGIGGDTAIFSLINALILQRLPVRDPGQLVELLTRFPNEPAFNGFSGEAFQLMHDQNHVFSGLIADGHRPFNVNDGGLESQTLAGGYVDGTFFTVLGLKPAIGRLIATEDDNLDRPSSVAVVSWSYWKSKFNLDPQILGKQIIVDDVPVAVVGVAPRGFLGLGQEFRQDVWLPLAMEPVFHRSVLGWGSLALVGRLKPGVSLDQARAEMDVLWHSTMQVPNNNPFLRNMKIELQPAGSGVSSPLRQQFTTPLLVLMAIVSLLLLIACTNVAGLLLARGAARQHEMGVRICLGAGRLRLVRQALTESLLLSSIGSLLGVAIAYFGAHGLLRIIASGRTMPGSLDYAGIRVAPDMQVLLFACGVALLTGLLFGIAPALRVLSTVPVAALRQSGRSGDAGFGRLFGKSLVVTQVALSVVMLSAGALFIGYLSNLKHLDLGFRRDHLLLVSLDAAHSGYENAQIFRLSQELLGQLEAIPGVRSATLSGMTPISGSGQACYCVNVEGREEKIENHRLLTSINRVAPNYFKTYGTPLLAGREFSATDQTGPRVAIINQAMARDFFGTRDPIGMHFTFDLDNKPYEIVGVVADARYNEIREAARDTIYLDAFQASTVAAQLTLRTSVAPEALAPEVQRAVNTILRTVPVTRITTMADQIDASIVPERLIATLSGCFAVLAALLAAIGLYGLLAYTVARRINEIGIRMALGAARSNVMRMVLRDALELVCLGLLIGAPLAFWGKKIAMHLIQDLPAKNAASIVLGAIAMFAVALLAAYFPARRATRVDPMIALRYE